MKRNYFATPRQASGLSALLIFSVLAGSSAIFASCSSGSKSASSAIDSDDTPVLSGKAPVLPTRLSRELAIHRSKMVNQITYQLEIDLTGGAEEFQGKTILRFDLKPKGRESRDDLVIDFEGGALTALLVNGSPVDSLSKPERYDGHHITVRHSELKPTGNQIEVSYKHSYSHDGRGLHRFQDPVDNKPYLYTHFEPYDAHRMFPCFDQPDLKATYELSVKAPGDWEVISNTLEKTTSSQENIKTWKFSKSQVFSTYLFALHAGPYAMWKSTADQIPIRLFARKSLAKYIDHQEWFKITSRGLDYYGTQFGYPYPFGKYDQVLVPDFNAGAMENVGAVTFSEIFVFRSQVTNDQRRRRAETILHEMAHMWFGDLVTMKWWNGLWLNESFATFMSSKAVDEATDFKGTWQAFYTGNKQWAYWEDQLVTTHPIENPVVDTDVAESIFDGITYGKGASVLKQLQAYLGEDEFKEGLQRYFQKYAFKNTTISDFFRKLSEASNKDLVTWQKSWLQSSGVNTIKADWVCETHPETHRSVISKFDLIQTGTHRELRTHRTQIAVFESPTQTRNHSSPLILKKSPVEVTYQGPRTQVEELIGKSCPTLVFPNYQDYDYAKIELDPVSLQTTLEKLPLIQDPLTRQMLWHSLWEMVVDGKLRPQDYAEAVLKHAGQERDTLILSKILQRLAQPSLQSASVIKFLEGSKRHEYQSKIEGFIESHLGKAPAGSDLQLIWYRAFLNIASSDQALAKLKKLVDGKFKLRGFKVDQERRWEMIQTLASHSVNEIDKLIQSELKSDPTDMGQKSAIAAETSLPDLQVKKKWASLFIQDQPSLPVSKLRVAMGRFHLLGQETLAESNLDFYFENLPKIAQRNRVESDELVKNFAHALFPSLCDPRVVDRATRLLERYPRLPAEVIKSVRIHKQEEERCIQARERSKS